MKIVFELGDREVVQQKLDEANISSSDEIIDNILEDIAAAFIQQFDEEVKYFVTDMETV